MISERAIGRLTLYVRTLYGLKEEGVANLYSHELASKVGASAAQVRRDLMTIGYEGSPSRGYEVSKLLDSLEGFLDTPEGEKVALIGVGNLGRALLSFFVGRRSKLSITAAFDNDPSKTGRVVHGCRCYAYNELEAVLKQEGIGLAILAVPAGVAQEVADQLVAFGVNGILNFATVSLRVPKNVYLENIDLAMSLEKVTFFARQCSQRKEA